MYLNSEGGGRFSKYLSLNLEGAVVNTSSIFLGLCDDVFYNNSFELKKFDMT